MVMRLPLEDMKKIKSITSPANFLHRLQGEGIGAVLVRGAGGSFAVKVLGIGIAFGTNLILARLLGVTQYGVYLYVLTWINLLALMSKLGLDTSLLRFVSAYNARHEWGLLRGILGRSTRYVALASLLIGGITAIIILFLYDRIGPEQAMTFWIALLLLPVLALTGLRQAVLQALRHVVQAELPDSIIRPLLLTIMAGVLYSYTRQSLSASHTMIFNLLSAVAAFSVGTWLLLKALPEQVRHISSAYAGGEWLRVSLPLLLISGMYIVLNQTDIIMIGFILGAEKVGIYAVASRIAGLIIFGLTAASAIAAPIISDLYSTGKHRELQRMITLSAQGIFIFTLPAAVLLVLSGRQILSWFGEGFMHGYGPLLILMSGQLVNALAGLVGFLMTMTGHQKEAMWIVGFSSLLNIIFNGILIPTLGITGAAIATAITTALWNIAMFFYVQRHLGINSTIFVRR